MEHEDGTEELTLADVLDGFKVDIETFFVYLEDEGQLDDDQKAGLTRQFEEVAELVDEARKLVKESLECE